MNARDFENWCGKQNWTTFVENHRYAEYLTNAEGNLADKQTGFRIEIENAIRRGEGSVLISIAANSNRFPSFKFDFANYEPTNRLVSQDDRHIGQLELGEVEIIEIIGGAIGHIVISGNTTQVSLSNCFIARLSLANKAKINLHLSGCWIGVLKLTPESLASLRVDGGSIRSIDCPRISEENPFTGDVLVSSSVILPVSDKWPLYRGKQPYRDIRVHLEKLQNVPAANLFRSRELEAERADELGVNWIINWFYGACSDYGSKPGRALGWAAAVYLSMAIVILIGDGGVLGLTPNSYVGWRSSMTSEVWRSFILPLQSLINPFGLFGTRNLVVAATGWGKFLLAIQGLFCDALVLMAILGIRRRFRQR